MNLERIFVALLYFEMLACLYLAGMAWREAAGESIIWRGAGFLLGCSAAAVILYGILRS